MIQRIFYIFDKTTQALAYTETDQGVEFLVKFGILTPSDPVFILDIDTMTEEDVFNSDFVNLLRFKRVTTPIELEVHPEKATTYFLNELRKRRDQQLTILDRLQMRALGRSRQDLVKQMEEDKGKLRDLITPTLFANAVKMSDYIRVSPALLNVDYEAKYEAQLVGPL